jgi:hypothetical protein
MLREIQNNKKFFLDMSKAELISKSVVLVDKNAKTFSNRQPQETPQNIQISNSFSQLANILLLKTIIGKEGFLSPPSNPFSQDFVFGDFVVQNSLLPTPRFTIKQNTSDKKASKVNDITKKIIELGSLLEVVDGVGLNYEMFYNNEDGKINLKTQICKDDISSKFDSAFIRLEKNINSTKLTLTLSDAVYEGKKVMYILANFHNDVSTTNTLDSILRENFLDTLEKIVEDIFEKND